MICVNKWMFALMLGALALRLIVDLGRYIWRRMHPPRAPEDKAVRFIATEIVRCIPGDPPWTRSIDAVVDYLKTHTTVRK